MKFYHSGIIVLVLLMLVALVGCNRSTTAIEPDDTAEVVEEQHDHDHEAEQDSAQEDIVEDIEPEPDSVSEDWPENDYTMHIPEFRAGKVDRTEELADDKRFVIYKSGVTEDDVHEYIEFLEHVGYELVVEEHEEVSMGAILKNDYLCVSLALSRDQLTLELINVEGRS